MRSIKMPTGEKPSQDEVLRRIALRKEDACVVHIRVLLVHDEGAWITAGGRIDIARQADQPVLLARPVGGVRMLTETVPLDELALRLTAAFSGAAFAVAGEQVAGHGMQNSWQGGRYTDSWPEYGVSWPVVELAPSLLISPQPYLHDAIEAEGKVEALDGVSDCVRLSLGYVGARDVLDIRGKRFAIYVWDYRGVFRAKPTDEAVRFGVEPSGNPSLKLSMVARHDGGMTRRTLEAPADVNVPITGALHALTMTLRHGNDIVCELMWRESTERFRLQHDGVYDPPPVGPAADPIDAGSTIAEAVLPFMADAELARMVARDLAELDSAVRAANVKSAVVLAGSILEAVLLDVLGRNENEARQRLGKRWPDRASGADLIATASGITVVLPDGTTRPLLPPLTATKGGVLVDHRDLIHPRREVRGAATIDANTVQTMQGVLGEVLRDLREAHAKSVLDEYGAGKIV